jgi:hypothetical protein
MTRLLLVLTIAAAIALLTYPAETLGAERSGIRIADQHEFSSRARKARVARLHYYDPYPWWWHPPHVKRARTNYLGWPHTHYPRDYDLPYPNGVAGYPGGFWLMGL